MSRTFTKASYNVTTFERHVRDFVEELKRLEALQEDVHKALLIGERQGKRTTEVVSEWLKRVEAVEFTATELLEKSENLVSRGCWGPGSPRIWLRHKTLKKIDEIKCHISELLAKGKDIKNDTDAVLSITKRLAPSETSTVGVGVESVLNEVGKFLEDEKGGVIGLYGMAGVGKTTLLKRINDEFLNKIHGFDEIIWIVVSRDATLEKVQHDIWRRLGLPGHEWQDRDRNTMAAEIFKALTGRRFALLLDDLWHPFDLKLLGIPLAAHDPSKSKVIFTTRSLNVCDEMGADRTIQVKTLTKDEAWALFQRKVGEDTVNSHPEIRMLAHTIVEECHGLPLALSIIGRSMAAKKSRHEWEHALQVLRSSPFHFSAMGAHLFPTMKYTYDNLSNKATKECFLYCSLFPQEFPVDKDQLIDYWISEGILDKFRRKGSARNAGYNIIGSLTYSCLLEDDGKFISMHPLVRDMALRIASDYKGDDKLVVRSGLGLTEVPVDANWKDAEKVSLMHNCITQLPEKFSGPIISTLLLSKNHFNQIPDDFFLGMPQLRVLDLSSCGLEELPGTIGELAMLRYLNLSRTKLKRLPVEIRKLTKLEFLDLSYIAELSRVPEKVFSEFQKLQVLNMYHCGYSDSSKDNGTLVGGESFLEELEGLPQLSNLGISIRDEAALQKVQNSPKLLHCTSSLSISRCKGLNRLQIASTESMKSLDMLEISHCTNLIEFDIQFPKLETISPHKFIEDAYFNNLQLVRIEDCWSLEDLTWLSFAPNLKSLHLEGCMKLVQVINMRRIEAKELIPGTFLSLEKLYLNNLPALESINNNVLPFPCLKELTVIYCPKLTKIPIDADSGKSSLQSIKGERLWWEGLRWENESARQAVLPYFSDIP